jgi:hypothetical protein
VGRQGHLIAVVGVLLIGCAVLLVVGCAGVGSEAPQKEQGHTKGTKQEQEHTEATKNEQTRSPEATASEEARCEGTQTFKTQGFTFITNDLPGCPEGGPLSGTDKPDKLDGKDGDDQIRGLGAGDFILGGAGNDVIYGGDGNDQIGAVDGQRDKLYCGKGKDEYNAEKIDYVDSSCEKFRVEGMP